MKLIWLVFVYVFHTLWLQHLLGKHSKVLQWAQVKLSHAFYYYGKNYKSVLDIGNFAWGSQTVQSLQKAVGGGGDLPSPFLYVGWVLGSWE